MGGRHMTCDHVAMERYFNVRPHPCKLHDRYPVAPGTAVPVIRVIDRERPMSLMHWGLIPFWAKDTKIGFETINARGETTVTKPAF
jgi:putative SOS response-associated peptidase YedK